MDTIKSIFAAKTLYWHLLIRLVLFCFCVGFGFAFVVPLLYWAMAGEGSVAEGISNSGLDWFIVKYLAWLIGLIIIAMLTGLNIKNRNFSKAKSYIIIGIVLIILYPFKEAILDAIFYEGSN